MADAKEELRNALHRFVGNRQTIAIQPATVKSVDEMSQTCDVEDADGIEIYDVRLRAAATFSDEGFLVVPEIDSAVLIGNIGNSPGEFVVLSVCKVKKVLAQTAGCAWRLDEEGVTVEHGTTTFNVNQNGVQIERGGQSLNSVLGDLITQLKLLTVTCAFAGSPSSPPLNAAAFEAVKTNLNLILN